MKTWVPILIVLGIFTFGFVIGIGSNSIKPEVIIQEKVVIQEKIVNPTTGNPTIDFLMTSEGVCSSNKIILAASDLIEIQEELINIYLPMYSLPDIDYSVQLEVENWCKSNGY